MSQFWHDRSPDDALAALGASHAGLTPDEAEARLEQHGPNLLQAQQRRSAWRILLGQFKSIVVIVMVAAFVLAIVTQHWPESVALFAVIIFNTAVGFVSEWKAARSMEALSELGKQTARVRRGDEELELSADQIVPGDIVIVEAPLLVPADLRLVASSEVRANEAALTGESVPVWKDTESLDPDTPLADRTNMLYKGTNVVDGRGEGVVVATGMQTEVGRISELAAEAEAAATPLQQRLDRLGRRMAWIVFATAAIVAGAGLLGGQPTALMIETAIALGVAAIPEGLPIVATIALARGMWIMSRRNALINRLPAVETLGATNVIFTDKTGTLTENHMVLRRLVTSAGQMDFDGDKASAADGLTGLFRRAVRIAVLCNNARLNNEAGSSSSGDPLEVALLEAGVAQDMTRDGLERDYPRIREVEFSRDTMKMATVHRADDGFYVAVKGAAQRVLEACTHLATDAEDQRLDNAKRREWADRFTGLARAGLRVLALADKRVADDGEPAYENLCLVGAVGLYDPPRADVRAAIDQCQAAGVLVVMVTGDQPETAHAIAEAVGIVGDPDDPAARVVHGSELKPLEELDEEHRAEIHRSNIFARVTPEQKLNLISVYQDFGDRVAMTGDGINDAPALKKADIGIAMGQRGTEAAKQVADMVLRDDAFSSIVRAIAEGRVIFGNIRASVMFMLCTNGAEVLTVALASLIGAPLPLRPLQILYLNMLTDVFPALALAVGKGPPAVMDRPPRDPGESVLRRDHWLAVGGWSVLIGACVLSGLAIGLLALGLSELAATTVSFLTLAFAKLWFVFSLRDKRSGVLRNEVTRNPWIWGSLVLCIALLLAAVYVPGLNGLLDTRHIGWSGWGVVLGLSVIPTAVGNVILTLRRGPAKRDQSSVTAA